MNNAPIIICVCVFVWIYIFISLGYRPRIRFAESYGNSLFNLLTARLFSKVAAPFHILTSNV